MKPNMAVQEPLAVSKRLAETIMTGGPDALQIAIAGVLDAEIRPLVEALESATPLISANESFTDGHKERVWNQARAALERATE